MTPRSCFPCLVLVLLLVACPWGRAQEPSFDDLGMVAAVDGAAAVDDGRGAVADEEPGWKDVDCDLSGGLRLNNKVTLFWKSLGQTRSESVGSATMDHLVDRLQHARRVGRTITQLEIKGHGAPELQQLGAETFLIACNGSVLVQMRDGRSVDVTALLLEVLAPDAKVNLNGCKTGRGDDSVAQEASRALPGRIVTGGAFYQASIPFTAKSFGTKNHFRDGKRIAKKWYRVD